MNAYGVPGGPMMYEAPRAARWSFPSHLYARGPRDYFMIDVDPANSRYTYGAGSPLYGQGGNGSNGGMTAPE